MAPQTKLIVGLATALVVTGAAIGSSLFAGEAAQAPTAVAPQSATAAKAPNLCLQCHLTNGTARSRAHLVAYQRSEHALNDVGCAACHGGDPTAIDPMRAHLKVLGPEDPESPINVLNVAETCGKCHAGVLGQFKLSKHYALMKSHAEQLTPTCTVCHADGGSPPTADSVGRQCAQCHRAGSPAGHIAAPAFARMQMLEFASAKILLDEAGDFVELIPDAAIRAGFQSEAVRARAGLTLAAESSHAMVFDNTRDRLSVALERVLALNRRMMTTLAEAGIK